MKAVNVSGKEPVGYKTMSNVSAILVFDILYGIDDYVVACWDHQTEKPVKPKKLYTTSDGRSYFKLRGRRFHLDEIMRVNR